VNPNDITVAEGFSLSAGGDRLPPVQARILPIDPVHPEPYRIQRAVAILEAGGVIAFPTDSYYGIGCDLASKKAIERIYLLKERSRRKPLSVICSDLSEISRYAKVSNFAYRVLKRLAPGPFTFVIEATKEIPDALESKQHTVGIRIPNAPVALALVEKLGRPLVSTSAAAPDGEPLIDPQEILDVFGHGLDLIIDGGYQLHEPSTVLSLVGDELQILRQGKGDIHNAL
jgi:tRNA threonylcarbamoyl adenosine modification protein (Sua5/YciO/YrdC/YwlC family)